ncbi:MAG: DNA polymerase I [Desulfitobacterium sp.]|nr:DNA polymerase I [Desulfitobacterium sp.]
MAKILILDGNSLANRAFYALPMMTTNDGKPTNALHGFMTMLLRLLSEQKPDYWVVAFDKTKATVRIEQYAEYKAQRKETPEALKPQFDYLKELLTEFSVPILECAGYEADDIIAAVTSLAEKKKLEVQIYTGDRDALQLVSPYTTVYLTRRGITDVEPYTEAVLKEKYNITPSQVVDLKGLMGDTSDNIPGVPGIGEKTGLKLLWEYGTVENVLENIDKVSGKKLKENLQNNKEQALLSKKLATLIYDVPIEIDLDKLTYRRPNEGAFAAVLDKYSLKTIARLWREHHSEDGEETVVSEPAFNSWPLQELKNEEWLVQIEKWHKEKNTLVLAYEYSDGNPHWAKIRKFGIATDEKTYILDWDKTEEDGDVELRLAFKNLLEDPEVPKKLADSKLLITLLGNEKISLTGLTLDLSLAGYLINSNSSKFDPLQLVKEYFTGVQEFAHLGEEAAALAQIVEPMTKTLEELGLTSLLHDLEEPLSPVLAQMERQGIALDTEYLEKFGEDLTAELKDLEEKIYADAGENFNINSPQQLSNILFNKLGLPPKKKTKTGYSTDAETLEELRTAHPIVERILDYRQLNKLMTTYVNGLLAQVHDGRVHTTFQQTITATGRLSSTEPNLQNIPIRLEHGRLLRKAFKPTQKDWVLLSADYSQIELRVLAHYSEDEVLCESFSLNQDVHTRTASEVFGVPMEEVTSDLRRSAKAVNFGLIYGLSDFGLGRDLGISRKEAKSYMDKYFLRYAGVKKYLEEIVAKAKKDGHVRTLLNRLRQIPELRHPNRMRRQFGERIAMNTPIQGTAADIMKLAMLGVAEGIKSYRAHLLLQVHDELVLEVAPEDLPAVAKVVKEEMETAFPLRVPLKVDCKVGPNWHDMEDYFE